MEHSIEKELLEQLEHLSPERQRAVIAFARKLAGQQPDVPRPIDLQRFAGTISTDDLVAISEAIEAGCEQVNLEEW